MNKSGMSLIVKNVARLVTGFVALYGIYVAMTGHISPGGGFAGGVILAAAAVLAVLAFGGKATRKLFTESACHNWDALGALAFLVVAFLGYLAATGGFFVNFMSPGNAGRLASGGAIPLANLAILVKVGAGIAGVFLALSAFRPGQPKE